MLVACRCTTGTLVWWLTLYCSFYDSLLRVNLCIAIASEAQKILAQEKNHVLSVNTIFFSSQPRPVILYSDNPKCTELYWNQSHWLKWNKLDIMIVIELNSFYVYILAFVFLTLFNSFTSNTQSFTCKIHSCLSLNGKTQNVCWFVCREYVPDSFFLN